MLFGVDFCLCFVYMCIKGELECDFMVFGYLLLMIVWFSVFDGYCDYMCFVECMVGSFFKVLVLIVLCKWCISFVNVVVVCLIEGVIEVLLGIYLKINENMI